MDEYDTKIELVNTSEDKEKLPKQDDFDMFSTTPTDVPIVQLDKLVIKQKNFR